MAQRVVPWLPERWRVDHRLLPKRLVLHVFDEYAIKDWPGETQAVDEFFADKDVEIKTLDWTNVPGAYLVK